MKHLLVWVVFFAVSHAFALNYTVQTKNAGDISIRVDISRADFELRDIQTRVGSFKMLLMKDTAPSATVGEPELREINRWIAVDPSAKYAFKVDLRDPVLVADVALIPHQADHLEKEMDLPFSWNRGLYDQDYWYSGERTALGSRQNVGGVTVASLKLSPFEYNPKERTLKFYSHIEVHLVARGNRVGTFLASNHQPTAFEAKQLSNLVDNSNALNLEAIPSNAAPVLLVLTNDALMASARKLVALHPGITAYYEKVAVGASNDDVKKIITNYYQQQKITHVLIFGGKEVVPLYSYDTGAVGDAWYSFSNPSDFIATVGISRVPTSDASQADLLVKKSEIFLHNIHRSKNVVMAAHQQTDPYSYMDNLEQIRKAANPLNLNYITQYGAKGATNNSATGKINDGAAIVNYRGHGSLTAWDSWDSQGQSFDSPQIEVLKNVDERLSIFFNIACDTGGIQSGGSMAEKLLFDQSLGASSRHGAVAVLAATEPSYTVVNSAFDINLFQFLQQDASTTLSDLVALSNNKMLRDNPGDTSTQENVKMYELFSDPLLTTGVN